ncbi:hypothetical protein O181_060007 [Austropuccinia psidii MF-1]|uniref:RRM Nup35-type domain-containing protein n=1 Tax=Austropuccinia psidii MF-1 TaxID=1389203 RepID=A0A9Q3EMR0_9BASI|nr:hypothetical protein [Austropuccinia psidii MF-1]
MPFPQSPSFGPSGSGTALSLSPSVGADGPRQYSAGYISTAGAAPHHLDQSQQAGAADQDDWIQTPLHPNRIRSGAGGSASRSPYRASGSYSGLFAPKDVAPSKPSRNSGLFGTTPKMAHSVKSKLINDAMEDDAPPKASLLDDDGTHSKPSRNDLSSHRSLASSLATKQPDRLFDQAAHTEPVVLAPSSVGYKVHVFGFTSPQQSFVMNHFTSIGELVCPYELSPEGGNWATITYKHSTAAQRAVRKNGEILGGIIMIGCKWADSSGVPANECVDLNFRPMCDQNKFATSRGGMSRTNSMIVSRQLKTYDSTEAFAAPTQNTEKGFMGRIGNAGKPNPAIFKEHTHDSDKAMPKNSLVNRAMDLVFGW